MYGNVHQKSEVDSCLIGIDTGKNIAYKELLIYPKDNVVDIFNDCLMFVHREKMSPGTTK